MVFVLKTHIQKFTCRYLPKLLPDVLNVQNQMAHCSVLEAHQKLTDRPSRRIKRSGGHSLVRRGLAVWIEVHILLQMKAEITKHQLLMNSDSRLTFGKHFIPAKLPSHKTPGTKAIGPVVERSRERRQLIHAAKHPQIWNPIERSGISAINPIL